MRDFGLDHLSLFDLPPAAFIEVAAKIGCRTVGLFAEPVPFDGAAQFDMRPGGPALRDAVAALDATGLVVQAVDPFLLLPKINFDHIARNLEISAALRAVAANVVVLDDEPGRRSDHLARLTEMAKPFGVSVWLEAYPLSEIRTVGAALALAEHVASCEVGLTIDSLHVKRGGGNWDDVAALPQERIRYVQLSDGPAVRTAEPAYEAVYERGAPGDGEFDLGLLLAALPIDLPLSIEAPSQRLKAAGLSPLERARTLAEGLRRIA
ncbi:MAG TPA: sugar phosphate isomerase/epimerase [Alphaproteobacteria bacterium]|nr:sugar phosphate isomerase/epimerase [Alphaproteobacteria bacterium]